MEDKKTYSQKDIDEVKRIADAQVADAIATSSIQKINEMIEKSSVNVWDTIESNVDTTSKMVKDSIGDAYENLLNGTGAQDKNLAFTKYIMTNNTLNYMLWLTMYNDSWVFKKAIDNPARDEIRCGITINNVKLSDEQKKDIYDFYESKKTDLIDILKWGALFGGSVGVVMFDTLKDEDYSKPINTNISKIKHFKSIRIYSTDRWFGLSPEDKTVKNMNSLDFGKPAYYKVTFANGHSIRVHHDYILRYEHRNAPKLIKTGLLQNWGYAEGAHIIQELVRDDQLKSDILSLVNKSLIEVIKMDGMKGLFMSSDPKVQEQLNKRLEMVNWGRNFNSLTFLDTNDDYQEHGFSGLTGLSDLLETNMWLVAAALDMPGVLFGELKGGLSNESDAYEKYAETILSRCDELAKPVVEKLLHVYYKAKGYTVKPKFAFNSLARKKQNKEKMEAIEGFTRILSQMLQDGVIDTVKYAKLVQQYTQTGIVNVSFTKEEIEELETNFEEEMENIDEDENETTPGQNKPEEKDKVMRPLNLQEHR